MSEENKYEGSEEPAREESVTEEPTREGVSEPMGTESLKYLLEEEPTEEPPKLKKKRRISLSTFLMSSIALILAAVMTTYTCCNLAYRKKLTDAQISQVVSGGERYYPFELFDAILQTYSIQELDEDQMLEAALHAYVAATGDPYAAYYTAEEYQTLMDSTAGKSEGVGINVINTTEVVGGVEYKVFRVINVIKDSPAANAGLKLGDLIWAVGEGESAESLNDLGYDLALEKLRGESGTVARFLVLREAEGGYEQIPFAITRSAVTTVSVYSHRSTIDSRVGVVKIIQFDLTTPKQFSEAVDGLLAEGCDRFVFDVRYNPGGDRASVEAVLSYFLSPGDVIIRVKDKTGREDVSRVEPTNYEGSYAACNIVEADIGKYKELDSVVLCNGSTASAAELFAATFRDYGIAPLVGTKTYGKGSMQTIMSLSRFGYSGALKLTTALYFSAKDEAGYDGVGIAPDHEVEQSEAASNKNVYEILDEEDDQLKAAIALLG